MKCGCSYVRTQRVSVHTYTDISQLTLWQAHQSQCSQKAEHFQHHLAYCRVHELCSGTVRDILLCQYAGGKGFTQAVILVGHVYDEIPIVRGQEVVINMLSAAERL